MRCDVLRAAEQKTSVWSGGKTTELFLYPPEASYASRDFQIRISTATVDLEQSDFTSLPGFHRILMPLSASMRLVHEGRREVELSPYQVDEFEGEWKTVSYGSCVDFGIMLAAGWSGSLKAAGSGELRTPAGFTGIYAMTDNLSVKVSDSGSNFSCVLMKGDFLLADSRDSEISITLSATAEVAAVIAAVRK